MCCAQNKHVPFIAIISQLFYTLLIASVSTFDYLFQVASLFASYILGYISPTKIQSLLVTHMVNVFYGS